MPIGGVLFVTEWTSKMMCQTEIQEQERRCFITLYKITPDIIPAYEKDWWKYSRYIRQEFLPTSPSQSS
jgi:hypothetical protein